MIEPLTLDPSERLYGTAVHAATDAEGFWVGWAILDKDGRELWSGKFVPPDPRYRRDTGGETWAHGWHVEDELVEHWAARSAVARLRLAREARRDVYRWTRGTVLHVVARFGDRLLALTHAGPAAHDPPTALLLRADWIRAVEELPRFGVAEGDA